MITKRAIEIPEHCLSFYSHPNISDVNFILVPHFNRTQIFQIDLSRLKKKHILIFLLISLQNVRKKGRVELCQIFHPKKLVRRYLQSTIFTFKLKFHLENGLVEQCYFQLFFLGMVYIFILHKIVAQRGRLQPFSACAVILSKFSAPK